MGYIFKRRHQNGNEDDDVSKNPKTRLVVPNHLVSESVSRRNHPNHHYANNKIKTSKYNLITFIPKNLFEQFHQYHKIYFFAMACISFIPATGVQDPGYAFITIGSLILSTAFRDAIEDFRRYKSDKIVNHFACRTFSR